MLRALGRGVQIRIIACGAQTRYLERSAMTGLKNQRHNHKKSSGHGSTAWNRSSGSLREDELLRSESFIVERLRRAGVPVFKVALGRYRIMHHKFMLVDGK